MEATVQQRNLEVHHREAGHDTFRQTQLEALLHGWPEFARHVATGDLRLELEALARLQRLDAVVNLGELSGTTRLLLVGVAVFDHLGDGFAIGDLGSPDFHLDAVRATQDVDLDVQMQLPPCP